MPPIPSPTALPEAQRTRCEVWTRVMGYHRPVSQWNIGKQSEHAERVPFKTQNSSFKILHWSALRHLLKSVRCESRHSIRKKLAAAFEKMRNAK